jgi:secreted trypsin-like serine protease
MHDVRSPIIPNDKCGIGEYSRTDFARDGNPISNKQICSGKMDTGGVGICHGDSGGPLMCQTNDTFYITGIVSWSSGCAEKNAPDVLTKVNKYLNWIAQTTSLQINDENVEKPDLESFECYRYHPQGTDK